MLDRSSPSMPGTRPNHPEFGDGTLHAFVDSIWTATTPIRFAGVWFPHVMAIVRLSSADLLLHSPCRPTDNLIDAIGKLGKVAHVVAPNWFHDLYLKQYRALYPQATFWAPAPLQLRQRRLIDCVLGGETQTPWFIEMPHIALSGLLALDECVFFHVPSRTLLVADLLMNASPDQRSPLLTKLGYKFFGLSGDVKVFPVLQWLGISSRTSIRRAAEQIFEWDPDHLIVGHGVPIRHNVKSQLRNAFQWLGK